MMLQSKKANLALVISLTLGTLSACSKKDSPKETAKASPTVEAEVKPIVAVEFRPSAQQKIVLDELRLKVQKKHWRISSKEVNKRANAQLFTYLAATERDEAIVGAALQAMYSAYSAHSKRKAFPDADYVAVVKHYLKSDNRRLVSRALLAARTASSGKKGLVDVISAVVALGKKYPDGAGRYALIDALRVVSATNRSDALMSVLTESIGSKDAFVASYALQAVYRSLRSVKDTDALLAKVTPLATHEDPGVRGRAIELLGGLGKDKPEILALIITALEDKHPYVRSEACDAVARLRHKPAVHLLIPLLKDEERNRHDIRGWTTLDDKPGRLHHDGSAWSYVFDSAMNAIRSLSSGELRLERVNPKQVRQDLDRNLKLTEAWYAKAKNGIPKK